MKKLKILRLSAILLMLIAGLSSVNADFTLISQTGSWEIDTSRITWHTIHGETSGEMYYLLSNVSDFAGYYATFNFTYLVNEPQWYELQAQKTLAIVWNFSNIYVCVSCEDVHNFGSLFDNEWFYTGSGVNNSGFSPSWWDFWANHLNRAHTDFNRNWLDTYEVFISKHDATHVLVEIYKHGLDGATRMISNEYEVSSDYWDSVDIGMKIYHSGEGYLYGGLTDTVYTGSYTPSIPDTWGNPEDNPIYNFINNLVQTVSKVLPSWMRSWINTFSAWAGYLFTMIGGILMGIFSATIPFLPLILIFYFLDAGLTSVNEGSFTPIGVAVMTIYNLIVAIMHTLVAIGQTIWDFIHFW